jgi:hypothetical protein
MAFKRGNLENRFCSFLKKFAGASAVPCPINDPE